MTDIDDIIRELGVSPSGVYADVRARLDVIEARVSNPLAIYPISSNYQLFIGTSGVSIRVGNGDPTLDGYADADGSLYIRTDGYSSMGLYERRGGLWKVVGSEIFPPVHIDGYTNVEQLVVNTVIGATSNIQSWRKNNTIVSDITSIGGIETTSIKFQKDLTGTNLGGGNGIINETYNGSLSIVAGTAASGNGNIVLQSRGDGYSVTYLNGASGPNLMRLGSLPGATTYLAIHGGTTSTAAPTITNYSFASNTTDTVISGTTNSRLAVGGTSIITCAAASVTFLQPILLSSGTNVATIGNIRDTNNTTIISARNAAHSANITILKTDASDQITIGDTTNTSGVFITANSSSGTIRFHGTTIIGDPDTTARVVITPGATTTIVPSASTNLAISLNNSNPATTGNIRAGNNTTIISARNAANSNNVPVIATDSSNQILIGDTTQTGGLNLSSSNQLNTISASVLIRDTLSATALTIIPAPTGATSVTVAAGATSFIFSQSTKTSDAAPINFTIRPQAPFSTATGTNRTPGSLVADVAVPTNSGTGEGKLTVTRAGIFSAAIGPYESAGSIFSAAYLGPNMTPSGTNFSFLGNGVDISYLNVPTGGTIYLSFQGSGATAGSIGLSATSLAFSTLSTPVVTQLDKTTNSGTGATFTVQAQNETGTTSIGGKLALTSGTGTTTAGNIELQTGGTVKLTVSPTLITSTLPIVLQGTNPATTGDIRAANNRTILSVRDTANSADLNIIKTDGVDTITVGQFSGTGSLTLDGAQSNLLRVGGSSILLLNSAAVTSFKPIIAPGIINAISYVVGTSATTDSTRALPADGYVTSVQIKILTPYSVGGTISVGQSGSTSLFAATTDINPQGTAGDIYAVEQWTQAASAAAIRVTVGGSPAAGQCVVIVKYTQPSG